MHRSISKKISEALDDSHKVEFVTKLLNEKEKLIAMLTKQLQKKTAASVKFEGLPERQSGLRKK